LRNLGLGGVVRLLVQIDKNGAVSFVSIDQSAHPYLDFAAVQAARQSAFEPVVLKGKPSPARFVISCGFRPADYKPDMFAAGPWPDQGAYSSDLLAHVLAQAGRYGRRLADAVMDFVCQEKIRDTHFSLRNNLRVGYKTILVGSKEEDLYHPRIVSRTPYLIMDPAKTKRSTYLCDYQVVRKDGAYQERRIILKENGRAVGDPPRLLEDRRVALLSPLFAPLRILLPERQERFFFRIRGEEGIRGQRVYVLEASPRSGDADGIWAARIWIDRERFVVYKCEIEGIPVEGYEDILKDCVELNIRPDFVTRHEYKVEREGLILPWRSAVRVSYPDIGLETSVPKNDISFSYDDYRFFTVSSEHRIIR
jgi:TonB family protein